MKNIYSILLAIAVAATATAQTPTWTGDSALSRICIDVNGRAGLLANTYNTIVSQNNYLNAVNSNTGTLKFNNGRAYGGELQIGYFFGHKRNWGVGLGFNYQQLSGELALDNFHVEFQSTDFKNNIFRQVITAHNLVEKQDITSMNIPLVAKYKKRFSKHWGFTADGGLLFNVQMQNSYTASGTFDYEAIYKFASGNQTVYDDAVTPDANDYFITRDNYLKNNANGDVNKYFDSLRTLGYNVGLNVKPGANTGKVSYATGLGFVLKPSVNIFLSNSIALDLGLYYSYQQFRNNALNTYQLTNKVGSYNPILNSVSTAGVQSYGANVGVRIFFASRKDRDHDGVPDKRDLCPDDSGLVIFQGCPDSDGDGIINKNDSCPAVKGIAKFNGCPDTDGDGIQDKDDECPLQKGLPALKGCPDKDKDGIPDKDDNCPDVPGLAAFNGCPDTDGDGLPDNVDECPVKAGPVSNKGCPIPEKIVDDAMADVDITTPILFELNSTVIKEESVPVLERAARELKDGKIQSITIDGHTDATGEDDYNMGLSLMRAKAVKRKLISLGAPVTSVHIEGFGERRPVATNKTREGRMRNRRAVMKVK